MMMMMMMMMMVIIVVIIIKFFWALFSCVSTSTFELPANRVCSIHVLTAPICRLVQPLSLSSSVVLQNTTALLRGSTLLQLNVMCLTKGALSIVILLDKNLQNTQTLMRQFNRKEVRWSMSLSELCDDDGSIICVLFGSVCLQLISTVLMHR